jgi:hypothetical protein
MDQQQGAVVLLTGDPPRGTLPLTRGLPSNNPRAKHGASRAVGKRTLIQEAMGI